MAKWSALHFNISTEHISNAIESSFETVSKADTEITADRGVFEVIDVLVLFPKEYVITDACFFLNGLADGSEPVYFGNYSGC